MGKDHSITGHEGSEGEMRYSSTLSLILPLDEVAVNDTPHSLYPWEGDPVPIVEEAGWAPKLIWMGAENLYPTWI